MGVETASISCVLVASSQAQADELFAGVPSLPQSEMEQGCTPIGDLFLEEPEVSPVVACARVHEDLVYCSRRKVFTSVSPCTLKFPRFLLDDNRDDVTMKKLGVYHSESCDWDIEDPASAKLVRTAMLMCCEERRPTLNWLEENREILEKQCLHIPHLVYAEESDQLFLVLRFVMLMNPHDGGRPLDDALYGTFDIYLKAHPGLSKQERERLFLVIESRKLLAEASIREAQNQRLPVRVT